jgi:predicted HAD superfamily hydrolase
MKRKENEIPPTITFLPFLSKQTHPEKKTKQTEKLILKLISTSRQLKH